MPLFASSVRNVSFALVGSLSLLAEPALASPDYPSIVERELAMPCTPDCTICHTVSPGTPGTAEKQFAGSLIVGDPGLKAANPDSLVAALTRIKTDMTDSDGDTLSDALELGGTSAPTTQLTTDPNTPDSASMPSANVCPPAPAYGCGAAHVTPHPHAHTDLILYGLVASAVALGLWRRSVKRRAI